MYNIIDNFLCEDDFKTIVNIVNEKNFNWHLIEKANYNSKEGQFQFMHTIVDNGSFTSNHQTICNIILKNYCKIIKKNVAVLRARVNLFLKTKKNQKLGLHKDFDDDKIQTLLLYLEDSNGYTEFKNKKKIKSKKNRLLIFNSAILHQTVTQTDVFFRKNININFFEE
jgi:hypothetical protein